MSRIPAKKSRNKELGEQAKALGADAVVGIDIDYETVGKDSSMLMDPARRHLYQQCLFPGRILPATSPAGALKASASSRPKRWAQMPL
jgi:hypothetical protein